jgi:hypothetical protein
MKCTIKVSQFIIVISVILAALQCRDLGGAENMQARISVFVHWGESPIPGKQVELVQTGESKMTDVKGLAMFDVQPGSYVIRVYGINRGGPVFPFVDFNVEIKAGESLSVDVIDCIACA